MQSEKIKNYEVIRQKRIPHFLAFSFNLFVLIVFTCIFILFSGCGRITREPLKICPGKANVTDSLEVLNSQLESMVSLFANKGEFSIELYDYDKKELRKQHLKVRILLIKPPSEIFLQASAGIVDKAMILGSNTEHFWMQINPDPVNSYWWGKWSDQDEDAGIMINPKTVLESLGIAEIDANADWSLSNEGPYDILTKTENGIIKKKLFIYCCDYRVHKIEYYDRYGKPIVLAKLGKYKEVSPDFFIPFEIKINSLSKNIEDTLNLEIKLDSIGPATEKQENFKVVLPKTPSLDHIYQVIDGQWIEQ